MTLAAAPDNLLSPAAHARIQSARALIDGIEALGELAALLRAQQPRSAWELATAISQARKAFEGGGAWPRIRAGHRSPKDRHEELLTAMARAGMGKSLERVLDLLADD